MANYFSEHYGPESTASVAPPTSISNPRTMAAPGRRHATEKRSVARLDFSSKLTTLADEDNIVCFTMKSGDRPREVYICNDAAWDYGTLTLMFGCYQDHGDGTLTVLDKELFGSGTDGTATIAKTDKFSAGDLEPDDIGKALWELIEEGNTQGWTEDPQIDIAIVVHIDALAAYVANGVINLECVYTPAYV